MRKGFGTYVPPNRRGTPKEKEPSIHPTVAQLPKPKFLITAKNRQELVAAVTQSESGVKIPIAEPLPTAVLNEPETTHCTSTIPIADPLPTATATMSSSSSSSSSSVSSSTNEMIQDVPVTEEKGEMVQKRKPKLAIGTTGVYVPPSRRAATAADTDIPEANTKKRKQSIDNFAHSSVHPTLGDATVGLTSSSSKSKNDNTNTTLPTTKRGRGFQKQLMEEANMEQISKTNRIEMLKLIQQSETDQCSLGTTTRPETVFLDEVSASQRMIFHSLGIVVKKTNST